MVVVLLPDVDDVRVSQDVLLSLTQEHPFPALRMKE
jgi:hypothetical protein